jgi:hypothetical protein
MASTYLSMAGTGDAKKWTFSGWFKKCLNGSEQRLITSSDNSTYDDYIRFNSDDTISIGYRNAVVIKTNRKFRDSSGYYNIVVKVDTDQVTVNNRIVLYVNGIDERVNGYSTDSLPGQGLTGYLNYNVTYIGVTNPTANSNHFNGIMSYINFTDAYAYDASAFGSTDSTTGEWQINTSPSVTYGNNGFFILKNGNTITDQSGEGNNFTLGGGTLTKTEDNPSNVFNVWNVLDVVAGTNAPLENGNTTYLKTATGSTTSGSRMGTIGASSGKFYWEFKNKSNIDFITGIIRSNHVPSTGLQGWLANDAGAYGFYRTGTITVGGAVSSGTGMITVLSGNIVGVAVDLDNGKFYSHVNGTYMNSGDPTSGATGTGSLFNISLTNTYMPWVCNQDYNQPNDIEYNFGNGYFGTTAVTSAGTAGSTPGTFEYDVPSGYEPLTTKGLNA